MNFTIEKKLGIALFILLLCLLAIGISGLLNTQKMADDLHYISGPVWDAADGAMEGSKSIQHEALAVAKLLANNSLNVNQIKSEKTKIQKENTIIHDAIQLMTNSNLFPQDKLDTLNQKLSQHEAALDKVLTSDSSHQITTYALLDIYRDFDSFMLLVEDVGIEHIDELSNTSQSSINWNKLKPYWDAADNAMEARISLLEHVNHYYAAMRNHNAAETRSIMTRYLNELQSNIAELLLIDLYNQKVPTGRHTGKTYKNTLEKMDKNYRQQFQLAIEALINHQKDLDEYHLISDELAQFISEFETIVDDQSAAITDNIDETIKTSTIIFVIITLVALMILIGVYFYLRNTVIKPLKMVAEHLEQISQGEGDLTVQLPIKGQDEIAQLSLAFNNFIVKIHSVISKVVNTTHHISSSMEQLSSNAKKSVSELAHQQTQTEQAAVAMNEMASTVSEVAQNAENASAITTNANNDAQDGQKLVSETVESIQQLSNNVASNADLISELEQESQNIGAVLDVIRGIADQTNLLALNAAIEAARAGEQGRGFAVVADEVRTLAQKTQQSTQEIENMISGLQAQSSASTQSMERSKVSAERCVEMINDAGNLFSSITQAIANINDMNIQIASASEEQSAVAEEINRNVNTISDVTQNSQVASQQSMDISQHLMDLSHELDKQVSGFNI